MHPGTGVNTPNNYPGRPESQQPREEYQTPVNLGDSLAARAMRLKKEKKKE